jgi:hypothetical protein
MSCISRHYWEMKAALEVIGVDMVSLEEFVIYFSDNTYVRVTAEKLAGFFPDRVQVPQHFDENWDTPENF